MVTVQLRDADDPNKILFGPVKLPFEPRENKPIRIRPHFEGRGFLHPNRIRSYVITEVFAYEVFENEPERSGIVYLAREFVD